MFADHIVTTDELWAVGATFTLVAWGFAYLYVMVQAATPGSFTTLSSTGLSDVIPVLPFARSVLMIEQRAGVLYITMVITRMVGLTALRSAERPSRSSEDDGEA